MDEPSNSYYHDPAAFLLRLVELDTVNALCKCILCISWRIETRATPSERLIVYGDGVAFPIDSFSISYPHFAFHVSSFSLREPWRVRVVYLISIAMEIQIYTARKLAARRCTYIFLGLLNNSYCFVFHLQFSDSSFERLNLLVYILPWISPEKRLSSERNAWNFFWNVA